MSAMDAKKPSEVLGWLGSAGYRIVVDEQTRKSEEDTRNKKKSNSVQKKVTQK